jgi:hypothetical protein
MVDSELKAEGIKPLQERLLELFKKHKEVYLDPGTIAAFLGITYQDGDGLLTDEGAHLDSVLAGMKRSRQIVTNLQGFFMLARPHR